jgi:hypothetical protein
MGAALLHDGGRGAPLTPPPPPSVRRRRRDGAWLIDALCGRRAPRLLLYELLNGSLGLLSLGVPRV